MPFPAAQSGFQLAPAASTTYMVPLALSGCSTPQRELAVKTDPPAPVVEQNPVPYNHNMSGDEGLHGLQLGLMNNTDSYGHPISVVDDGAINYNYHTSVLDELPATQAASFLPVNGTTTALAAFLLYYSLRSFYGGFDNKLTLPAVEILWFPSALHTKVVVDGQIYNATGGKYGEDGYIEDFDKLAWEGKFGYYRFRFNVSEQELSQIKEYVANRMDKFRPWTCTLGASLTLTRNTGIRIPFPFSIDPATNALYLSALKLMGYHRLENIEFVGPRKGRLADDLAGMALNFPFPILWLTIWLSAGVLVFG